MSMGNFEIKLPLGGVTILFCVFVQESVLVYNDIPRSAEHSRYLNQEDYNNWSGSPPLFFLNTFRLPSISHCYFQGHFNCELNKRPEKEKNPSVITGVMDRQTFFSLNRFSARQMDIIEISRKGGNVRETHTQLKVIFLAYILALTILGIIQRQIWSLFWPCGVLRMGVHLFWWSVWTQSISCRCSRNAAFTFFITLHPSFHPFPPFLPSSQLY